MKSNYTANRYVLLYAICVMSLTSSLASEPVPAIPQKSTVVQVKKLLYGHEFKQQYATLVEMGEIAFPAFEAILTNPDVDPEEIQRIFVVLKSVKCDRSRFVEKAVERLGDSNARVRGSSVELLACIGSERDSQLLHILLSDGVTSIGYRAATTLATIGGNRDLTAFNVWLIISDHKRFTPGKQASHDSLREHVAKCRDELKARLDKEKTQKSKPKP